MSAIQQMVRDRHATTVRKLKECAERLVPPDMRVIILVYDGPHAAVRELSYLAPDQLVGDVKTILDAAAKGIPS